jgi:IS5 family transposase
VLAICAQIVENWQVQGHSDPNRELLDAAALCRQLVPDGSVEAFLADHRHQLFPDELFEDLFPSRRGRPSVPADVVASVMVLQALEGLSDRDAARALRDRISWKVACGLALDDEGFDYSALTYWRSRLRRSERPERIFEAVRDVVAATGALHGRSRRALDSTLLDDAVATQDTVTQLISAIRRVRRVVPALAHVSVTGHDYESGAKPVIAWDDPVAKDVLVSALVNDARRLLEAAETATTDEGHDAIGLLALVAGQDVEPGEEEGSWRIAQRVAKDRVISVVDPESRHMHKSVHAYRDGYKAHVALEPETGLITAAVLTPANVGDARIGPELLAAEPDPVTILADSAYGAGEMRAHYELRGHRQVIKPIALRRAVPGGFTLSDFAVDHEAWTVTCPAEHTVALTKAGTAHFRSHCEGCALRSRCTTSTAYRIVKLRPFDQQRSMARSQWHDPDVLAEYRRYRPMAERGIAWLVAKGNRRLRYRGVERNDFWLKTRAAALNLRRLVNLGLGFDAGWVISSG